jgi:hypothetical protein
MLRRRFFACMLKFSSEFVYRLFIEHDVSTVYRNFIILLFELKIFSFSIILAFSFGLPCVAFRTPQII